MAGALLSTPGMAPRLSQPSTRSLDLRPLDTEPRGLARQRAEGVVKTTRAQLANCAARVAELEADQVHAGWGPTARLVRAELRDTRALHRELATRLSRAEAELQSLGGATPGAALPAVRPGSRVQGEGPVQDLLRAGKLIEAVRQYRSLTGATLPQASAAIDALERGEAVVIPPRR